MRKIALVSGGAGFIGSHMVDLLDELGFQIRVVDNLSGGRIENLEHHDHNPNIEVIERDIRSFSPKDTAFKDIQYLFHFAGIGDIVPSIDHPIDYMSCNVLGTIHMLEGARYHGVKKFVYAASSSCYGLATQTPTSESALIQTKYPYALSKYQGEQAAFHWSQVYDLPVNSIRIFNAYGPRSRTTGAYGAVFGVFLKQKLANKPFTVVGDGTQTRDFIFVKDLVKAFYAAADTKISGEVFNIGSGSPKSVNHLVQLLGGGSIQNLPKRPGEPDCTWADITKARKLLQWRPEVPFEEGVAEITRNIEYWRDAPLWDRETITNATETWFKHLG